MPSAAIVTKALAQIRKRPANHDYFFSKLRSADWIEPLDQAGLFSEPPPALREGDTISFPFWPESQYLARIASAAPERVAAVMMRVPETDNARVHDDLSRAAAKLPGSLAARWTRKEIAWVERQEHLYFLLPESLGELIAHLAVSGESQTSLTLAREVLSVKPLGDNATRASARVDSWNYEQLLQKHFPSVLRATAENGLALLCNLLDNALVEEPEDGEDYSWIWRPAIEPHEQNQGDGDLRDALIDAIRDGSKQLIENGGAEQAVLQALLKRKRPVFKRLALHVFAENHSSSAARELACDRENFFDERLRHEYSQLLAAVFSALGEEARSSVLAWIEEGPSRVRDDEGEDPALQRKRRDYWQAQRLFGLRGQLPEEWEQRYSEIVSELGEFEHADLVLCTTSWTGPTSPKEAYELEAMSAHDIASFLKTWEPTRAWDAPEPEGLGRVFQTVVANAPDRFVGALDSFRDIDPTYARALVQGLSEAVKAGQTVEWTAITEYLAWVAGRPRDEMRESSGRLDRDPHWGWARKAVVGFLSRGFEKNSIDFSLRERTWQIVDTIAGDPDPTVEDDEKSTMDPATRSINTTRGEALHAVVRYALWVRRQMTRDEAKPARRGFDMDSIPEVRERLEWHLDLGADSSPAIRAVFGQWFPSLLSLDGAWAESKVDSIFPADDAALRDAAWHTYLAFCSVYNESFRILRSQYSAGVDRLQSDSEVKAGWLPRPGGRLGEHLMVMIGRGGLAWADTDGLVKRFFDRATVSDASQAVGFVGRSLGNEANPVPDEVVERFHRVWEELARHVLASSGARTQLLKPFGWWFASGRFDAKWAFEQVGRVIEAVGGIEPDFRVMERLAQLAPEHPARCLDVLKALARRDERGWNVLGWKDSARTVLQAALDAEATNADAKAIIHELGARGHLQFRELLSM